VNYVHHDIKDNKLHFSIHSKGGCSLSIKFWFENSMILEKREKIEPKHLNRWHES
jgi:hypothetical protein